ncbi:ABC transporter permease [bacterium]|nr:ABC transporter permease [bacterium]
MKLRMFLDQLRIEMKLFLRDKQSVFWTFFFPILLILMFGYIFGKPDSIKFGLAVVDEDQSQRSQELVSALENISVLKVERGGRDDILEKLKGNEKNIAVIINRGYAESLTNGGTKIEVVYDQTQAPVLQVVLSILRQLVNEINWRAVEAKPLITIETTPIQTARREQRYIDFLLPGVIGMSLMSTCLFSIGMVVVAYREKGKLRRLSVTPLPKSIFIGGQMVNRYIIVLLQALLLIGIGMVLFDVEMVGGLLDFWAALTVGMLAFIAIGFLVASIANTTETASGISNSLFLPMMFLSGVYFSVDGIPSYLKPIVEFLPLTHLVRAIRAIFNNGVGFADVLPQMGILSLWVVVCFAVSIRLFKWE